MDLPAWYGAMTETWVSDLFKPKTIVMITLLGIVAATIILTTIFYLGMRCTIMLFVLYAKNMTRKNKHDMQYAYSPMMRRAALYWALYHGMIISAALIKLYLWT